MPIETGSAASSPSGPSLTEVLPSDAAGGGRLRRLLTDQLEAWGLAELASPLELAAIEQFTNAITHGEGPVLVRLSAGDARVRLEVHDRGGGRPALRPADPTGRTLGGWGLRMVDQLADAWGTEVGDRRTVVWVELAAQPQAAGRN